MLKIKFKKILILTLFFVLSLFFTNKLIATTLTLNPSKEILGIGEQFYVDLMLDPESESINTIKGSISFSGDNLSFLRAEEGKSIVNFWVEKPKQDKNIISFAGVILNGFAGVIDPFNSSHKLPGLIIRLVFETKKSGLVDFSTSTFSFNLNDGQGTETEALPANIAINISNTINQVKYENKEDDNPELEAYITRDPNIFNNRYVLIFRATDKETGIKSVMIKEGIRDWKEIESPYLLKDQSRHSEIILKATNFSDRSVFVNIDQIPYNWKLLIKILIAILVIALGSLILKKIYAKKK
jgi:hypothetical protein